MSASLLNNLLSSFVLYSRRCVAVECYFWWLRVDPVHKNQLRVYASMKLAI